MNQNTAARDEVIDELREEIERLWKERNEARDTNIKYLKQIERLQIELKAAHIGLGGLQETVERLRARIADCPVCSDLERLEKPKAVNEQNAPDKCEHDFAETQDGQMTKLECRKCGFHFWEATAEQNAVREEK